MFIVNGIKDALNYVSSYITPEEETEKTVDNNIIEIDISTQQTDAEYAIKIDTPPLYSIASTSSLLQTLNAMPQPQRHSGSCATIYAFRQERILPTPNSFQTSPYQAQQNLYRHCGEAFFAKRAQDTFSKETQTLTIEAARPGQ